MKQPREIAVRALLKVHQNTAWSNLTFDAELKKYDLNSRDSAFAAALFYGVLERSLTLDACIAAHVSRPLAKLSPAVLEVLRLSIYQLLYMDHIPEHAALSEGVSLVRKLRVASASGFVNGVLRSFLRSGKCIPLPEAPLAARLSVEYSCPAPLCELWLAAYGEEATLRILAQSVGTPPAFLRVNTLKTATAPLCDALTAQGLAAVPDKQLEGCIRVEHTGNIQVLPEFKQGLFHVQDKSSQLCTLALEVSAGQRVLDACAAPGGKSFTLAQRMADTGEIVAVDLHPQRTGLIERRAAELGISCIKTHCADMQNPQDDLGQFDRVLCDVPCSGFGVIRRKPELKYKPLEQFAEISKTQYNILENSSQYCKVGGRLVYSTCTLNPAENTDVVSRFLREHPDFSPAPLPDILEADGAHTRTLLGEYEADGFFMAAFVRNGACV